MYWKNILKSDLTESQLKELFNKNTRQLKIMKDTHKSLVDKNFSFSSSKSPYLFISKLPKEFVEKFIKALEPFDERLKNKKDKDTFDELSREQQRNVILRYVQEPIKELGEYLEQEDLEKNHLEYLIETEYKGEDKEEILEEIEEVFEERGKFFTEEAIADKDKERQRKKELSDKLKRKDRNRRAKDRKINFSTSKIDSFEDSFPKSAQMFREWVESTSFKNLNELLGLVGSPTIGDNETIGRLRKFIKEQELSKEDKTALTAIADEMVKESNEKPRSNRRLSGNVIQSRALGLEVGKDSKMRKTRLSIKYSGDKVQAFSGKSKNFLDSFERLDLTKDKFFNNLNTRPIFRYWVEQSGYTGTAEKFIKDPDKSKYIKKVMRNIPEYPTNVKYTGILYKTVFKDPQGGYVIDEKTAPEEFAYFAQGLRDGIVGGKGARTAYDFNTLKKFNTRILPQLIDAIKNGVFVDEEGNRDFRLGPPVKKLMNRLSKEQEDKREIISVIGDVIRGVNISDKYQGSDKDTLAKIESDIREQLKEKIAGKTVASYLLTTFMQLYKREGILSSVLNTKTLIPVEYLKPQKIPEVVKKSLEELLEAIGEADEVIIKEDIGLILESLNKKQKQKVKAILNIADPTEYFGHDFLKLSELIRLLKTLGVVKGDKKLNKKILRYDEENVKVVKLAARLRKDYERLYDDLREMIYPKSGE